MKRKEKKRKGKKRRGKGEGWLFERTLSLREIKFNKKKRKEKKRKEKKRKKNQSDFFMKLPNLFLFIYFVFRALITKLFSSSPLLMLQSPQKYFLTPPREEERTQ